jgi:peptidoglycan/LPS O-acetylase OafA/YrhL
LRYHECGNTITYGLAYFWVVYRGANFEKALKIAVSQGLVFLGTASYSIYLSNPTTASCGAEVFKRLGIIYSVSSVLGSIFITLCVGAFMYRFVEYPLTDGLKIAMLNNILVIRLILENG